MPDVDREEAVRYIIDGLDPKPFRAIWDRLPQIVGSMIEYDLHFMRLTGVIAPDGGPAPTNTMRTRPLNTSMMPGWVTIPAKTMRI